ncbi:PEP-CTERM sorting domain-containing protein [Anabaena sp. CCY 9910]|uniref:PEP-CTERM sorting domain-containing protein n=1 Tax=Anabaena sp. CCY 9910 TaxID=3103870 RepID=UPI0039DFBA0F
MFTTNKLSKTFACASVTLGVAIGASMTASPAQAGTLGWDDGTSNFFEQVSFSPEDTFSVTFSPTSLGGVAAIFQANGEFAPPFPTIPPNPPVFRSILPPDSAVGNFLYAGTSGAEFIYKLTNDLVFQFDADGDSVFNPLQDVSVKYAKDSEFLGTFAGGGVAFELDLEAPASVITIQGINYDPSQLQLGFQDLPGGRGGQYSGVAQVSTPEPGSILGFIALAGLGLVSKVRKEKTQSLACARHQ